MLPIAAACLVANAVRETLGALLGESAAIALFEPSLPDDAAWKAIAADALVYRVRGTSNDACIVLRAGDASVLAAAAFGERVAGETALSPLERAAVDRLVGAIAQQLAPFCGPGSLHVEPADELRGCVSYVELQLERPARARIGVALAVDPAPEPSGAMRIEDLADLPLELCVALDAGMHDALALGAIEPGSVLPLSAGMRGRVMLAGRPLGTGECGVVGRYYAVAIDRLPTEGNTPVR
jgi:hypothetical protein